MLFILMLEIEASRYHHPPSPLVCLLNSNNLSINLLNIIHSLGLLSMDLIL
jgi:hypothetical protein